MEGIQKNQTNWQYTVNDLRLIIFQNTLKTTQQTLPLKEAPTHEHILNWFFEHLPTQNIYHPSELSIRAREPGDRIYYPDNTCRRKLKNVFQTLKIDALQRASSYIICNQDDPTEIYAIYPYFFAATK